MGTLTDTITRASYPFRDADDLQSLLDRLFVRDVPAGENPDTGHTYTIGDVIDQLVTNYREDRPYRDQTGMLAVTID